MSDASLIPVVSIENAWARASPNPDYQRSVTKFFKAPTFYIRCNGLYAGTSKANGKRIVYCDIPCSQRISKELTELVREHLDSNALPSSPPPEAVEDVQALLFKCEDDVKALFKDFKRLARNQRQERQLEAAHALLHNARLWTVPFRWLPSAPTCIRAKDTESAAADLGTVSPTPGDPPRSADTAAKAPQAHGCSSAKSGHANGCHRAEMNGYDGPAACSAKKAQMVRSHPLPDSADWGSGAKDDDDDRDDERLDGGSGSGSSGDTSTARRELAGCEACNGDARETSLANAAHVASLSLTAAATTSATTPGPVAPASVLAGTPLSVLPVSLRVLRTAARAEPVGAPDTPPSCQHPASSECSSFPPSGTVTPLWPPMTPRFVSSLCPGPAGTAGTPGTSSVVAAAVTAVTAGGCVSSHTSNRLGSAFVAGAERGQVAQAQAQRAGPTCSATGRGGADGVLVVCCCIDLEWWERDSSKVTEVGWTLWDNLTQQLESRHHIVAENEALVNRIHVPDHKHEFLFGASTTGSLSDGAEALQHDLDRYGEVVWDRWWRQRHCQQQQEQEQTTGGGRTSRPQGSEDGAEGQRLLATATGKAQTAAAGASGLGGAEMPGLAKGGADSGEAPPPIPRVQVVVVGHGLSQDLKAMSGLLGVTLPPGAAILDTSDLAWAALGGGVGQERQPMSLRVLLKTLDIPATKLHNGGNDARYTMEAMLALAALDTCAPEEKNPDEDSPVETA